MNQINSENIIKSQEDAYLSELRKTSVILKEEMRHSHGSKEKYERIERYLSQYKEAAQKVNKIVGYPVMSEDPTSCLSDISQYLPHIEEEYDRLCRIRKRHISRRDTCSR